MSVQPFLIRVHPRRSAMLLAGLTLALAGTRANSRIFKNGFEVSRTPPAAPASHK